MAQHEGLESASHRSQDAEAPASDLVLQILHRVEQQLEQLGDLLSGHDERLERLEDRTSAEARESAPESAGDRGAPAAPGADAPAGTTPEAPEDTEAPEDAEPPEPGPAEPEAEAEPPRSADAAAGIPPAEPAAEPLPPSEETAETAAAGTDEAEPQAAAHPAPGGTSAGAAQRRGQSPAGGSGPVAWWKQHLFGGRTAHAAPAPQPEPPQEAGTDEPRAEADHGDPGAEAPDGGNPPDRPDAPAAA